MVARPTNTKMYPINNPHDENYNQFILSQSYLHLSDTVELTIVQTETTSFQTVKCTCMLTQKWTSNIQQKTTKTSCSEGPYLQITPQCP